MELIRPMENIHKVSSRSGEIRVGKGGEEEGAKEKGREGGKGRLDASLRLSHPY